MKTVTTRSIKQAVKDGQAAGAWLSERAAHVLLSEFTNRKISSEGEASARVSVVMERLRKALGPAATDPAVADALQSLDGVIWDVAVEHEDRAWHAAWALAMNLKGGGGR